MAKVLHDILISSIFPKGSPWWISFILLLCVVQLLELFGWIIGGICSSLMVWTISASILQLSRPANRNTAVNGLIFGLILFQIYFYLINVYILMHTFTVFLISSAGFMFILSLVTFYFSKSNDKEEISITSSLVDQIILCSSCEGPEEENFFENSTRSARRFVRDTFTGRIQNRNKKQNRADSVHNQDVINVDICGYCVRNKIVYQCHPNGTENAVVSRHCLACERCIMNQDHHSCIFGYLFFL